MLLSRVFSFSRIFDTKKIAPPGDLHRNSILAFIDNVIATTSGVRTVETSVNRECQDDRVLQVDYKFVLENRRENQGSAERVPSFYRFSIEDSTANSDAGRHSRQWNSSCAREGEGRGGRFGRSILPALRW